MFAAGEALSNITKFEDFIDRFMFDASAPNRFATLSRKRQEGGVVDLFLSDALGLSRIAALNRKRGLVLCGGVVEMFVAGVFELGANIRPFEDSGTALGVGWVVDEYGGLNWVWVDPGQGPGGHDRALIGLWRRG